jgi:cytochrome c-type biogenesis protein CcmH/NrfG
VKWEKGRTWLRKAHKALEKGDLKEVTYAVTRAIKIAPDLPEALTGYAQVLSLKAITPEPLNTWRNAFGNSQPTG